MLPRRPRLPHSLLSVAAVITALALMIGLPAAVRAAPTATLVSAPARPVLLKRQITAALAVGEASFGPACANGIRANWATFESPYPGSPGARIWARTYRDECRIEFNRAIYLNRAWRAQVYSWPWLCTLVVHEYGHLTGLQHTSNPSNVMYPLIQRVFPPCRSRG